MEAIEANNLSMVICQPSEEVKRMVIIIKINLLEKRRRSIIASHHHLPPHLFFCTIQKSSFANLTKCQNTFGIILFALLIQHHVSKACHFDSHPFAVKTICISKNKYICCQIFSCMLSSCVEKFFFFCKAWGLLSNYLLWK